MCVDMHIHVSTLVLHMCRVLNNTKIKGGGVPVTTSKHSLTHQRKNWCKKERAFFGCVGHMKAAYKNTSHMAHIHACIHWFKCASIIN